LHHAAWSNFEQKILKTIANAPQTRKAHGASDAPAALEGKMNAQHATVAVQIETLR
jgi:hypothetical protein